MEEEILLNTNFYRKFINNPRSMYNFNSSNYYVDKNNLNFEKVKNELKSLINIINSIEELGIDVSKIKKTVYELPNTVITFELYFRYHQIYTNLYLKYGSYLGMKTKLNRINTLANEYIESSSLKDLVNYYLHLLEVFKEDENFVNNDFSNFIENLYKLGYKLMKLEFLFFDTSEVYNYFKNNYHDILYISKFIEDEIEELKSSLNYINGLKRLEDIINNKKELNNVVYFNRDIIDALNVCIYLETYKKIFLSKLQEKVERLERIYMSLNITLKNISISKKLKFDYKNSKLNLNHEIELYESWLKDYNNFVKGKEFLLLEQTEEKVKKLIINFEFSIREVNML